MEGWDKTEGGGAGGGGRGEGGIMGGLGVIRGKIKAECGSAASSP